MHCYQVRIILDPGESTLDVVITGVPVVIGISDDQISLPFEEAIKTLGKVKFRFAFLVGPIIDSKRVWEWTKAAV